MSKKNGAGKFILGAGLGAGLALLFAPKKGSELRDDLKLKLDDLVNKAKDIDVEEVSSEFSKKVEALKDEIKDLDKEKVLSIAKEKSEDLNNFFIKNVTPSTILSLNNANLSVVISIIVNNPSSELTFLLTSSIITLILFIVIINFIPNIINTTNKIEPKTYKIIGKTYEI